jgi:uncharacterized membrane protein
MSLHEVFQWIQSTRPAAALRGSGLTYPIIMTGHLTGMGLFGGMIAITDARLLGFAMRKYPIADLVNQLRVWKWIGGVLTISCGLMIWASKAEFYYYNPYLWAKWALLILVGVHALVFRSVYSNPEALDSAPQVPVKAKVAAWMSLFLWVGLVTAGRMIGYWDVPDRLRPKY